MGVARKNRKPPPAWELNSPAGDDERGTRSRVSTTLGGVLECGQKMIIFVGRDLGRVSQPPRACPPSSRAAEEWNSRRPPISGAIIDQNRTPRRSKARCRRRSIKARRAGGGALPARPAGGGRARDFRLDSSLDSRILRREIESAQRPHTRSLECSAKGGAQPARITHWRDRTAIRGLPVRLRAGKTIARLVK
ncbi:Hypothetical predicted protein, partial [Olea europaea subsp. europaea]